jgi:hypothetical protein
VFYFSRLKNWIKVILGTAEAETTPVEGEAKRSFCPQLITVGFHPPTQTPPQPIRRRPQHSVANKKEPPPVSGAAIEVGTAIELVDESAPAVAVANDANPVNDPSATPSNALDQLRDAAAAVEKSSESLEVLEMADIELGDSKRRDHGTFSFVV